MSSFTDKIEEILIKYDPEGLISIGAPKDEYRPEAFYIGGHIKQTASLEEIATICRQIFSEMFDDTYTIPSQTGDLAFTKHALAITGNWKECDPSIVLRSKSTSPNSTREASINKIARDLHALLQQ